MEIVGLNILSTGTSDMDGELEFNTVAHLGFRLIVVISLITCSSRKEKLGSNTPINFITSSRFSPAVGPLETSGDSGDSVASDSLS